MRPAQSTDAVSPVDQTSDRTRIQEGGVTGARQIMPCTTLFTPRCEVLSVPPSHSSAGQWAGTEHTFGVYTRSVVADSGRLIDGLAVGTPDAFCGIGCPQFQAGSR